MNPRYALPAALALLLSAASFACAQTPATPPIRMGLWQTEVMSTISGMPAGAGGAHTVVTQSCVTPETWKRDFQGSRSDRNMKCTTSNLEQSSQKVVFDESCVSEQSYNMTAHVEMLIEGQESLHGTVDTKMTGPNLPAPMTVSTKIQSKFLSADCGDVKPGQGKVVGH